jgi:hypothetical protein
MSRHLKSGHVEHAVLAAALVISLAAPRGRPARAEDIKVPGQAPTIQAAIDRAAVDGDRILVDEGTYPENLLISGKLVRIESTGCPHRTVIDGGGRESTIRIVSPVAGQTGAHLAGLTILGGRAPRGGGILVLGGPPETTVGVELERVIVRQNAADDAGGGVAAMSAPQGVVHIRAVNSLIARNVAMEGGGFFFEAAPGSVLAPLIVNSTIVENQSQTGGAGLAMRGEPFTAPGSPVAFNSIFWENRLAGGSLRDISGLTGGAVQFSDIGDGSFAGEPGNISQDPLFMDPASWNYHLGPGSPCVDGGVPAVGPVVAPDRDFDGARYSDDLSIPNRDGGYQPLGFDDNSPEFARGDANGDEKIDISDPVYTFGYLFIGTEEPTCMESADANDDDTVDLSDGVYTLSYLYTGGPKIKPPLLGSMGPDLTVKGPNDLPCKFYPDCLPK